jgi:hypothetical protein
MAIPTITGVDPAIGWAKGKELVKITGTDFRLYEAPDSGDTNDITQIQTVSVLFGSNACDAVYVNSATELVALTPAYTGDYSADPLAAVDITVRNLDDDGDPIAGEEVVASSAYTYKREPLRPPTLPVRSPFVRVPEDLIVLLRRYIMTNSGLSTHTDYSSDGIAVVEAEVPSLFLTDPEVIQDAYGAENESLWETQGDGSAEKWPPPVMHTLIFDLIGQTNNKEEFLTLMGVTRGFFRANPYYIITADVPADVSLRLPLVVTAEPVNTGSTLGANLYEFSLTFEVRRLPVLYVLPTEQTWPVDVIELQTQKVGGTLVEYIEL